MGKRFTQRTRLGPLPNTAQPFRHATALGRADTQLRRPQYGSPGKSLLSRLLLFGWLQVRYIQRGEALGARAHGPFRKYSPAAEAFITG